MTDSPIIIGIDLGTKKCSMAVFRNDAVEIIPNDLGEFTTPSVVNWNSSKNEYLVGKVANPTTTVFDVKRLMGLRFDNPVVKNELKYLPYKIEEGVDGKVMIDIGNKKIAPHEITTMILQKLKKDAETYLGKDVCGAVITVPSYFNNTQLESTLHAAKNAGLIEVELQTEAAAAICELGIEGENILVFDMGGGTLDMAVVKAIKGNSLDSKPCIIAKSVKGDTHLGGEDFDRILFDHFQGDFIGITNDQDACSRLHTLCEEIKISLSTKTNVSLPFIYQGAKTKLQMTRSIMENICKSIFTKITKLVSELLQETNIAAVKISQLVLVGGCSSIPRIQNDLRKLFPHLVIAPKLGLSAASGVAKIAADNIEFLDVNALPFSVQIDNKTRCVMIPRNNGVSKSCTKTFKGNGNTVCRIFQGENDLIRTIESKELMPPYSRNEFTLKLSINRHGILIIGIQDPRPVFRNIPMAQCHNCFLPLAQI
jgi:molecular chaperone DnaK (HSP70)